MKNHNYRKVILPFVLCLQIIVLAFGQDNNSQFELANKYAQEKQYDKAIQTYQGILKNGVESSEVEFNLANTYLIQNKIGDAILHFERAAILAPRDKSIRQNLRLANEKIEMEILPQSGFFLTDFWNNLMRSASSNLWSVLAILFLALGFGGLALWQIGKDRKQRKQGFLGGIILIALSIIPFALASGKAKIERNSGEGIVLVNETKLQAASEGNSATIKILEAGIKVKILDNINNWYKVKLMNGEEGWLPEQAFEEI